MEKSVHMRAQHIANENYVVGICVSSLEHPKHLSLLVSIPSQESSPQQ